MSSLDSFRLATALGQSWERIAANELSQILYGICSMGFDSPQNLADRLDDVSEWFKASCCNQGFRPAPAPKLEGDFDGILQDVGRDNRVIQMMTTPAGLYILVAHLQLALRHPDNTGSSAVQARLLTDAIIQLLLQYHPKLKPVIDAGWDESNDLTRAEFNQLYVSNSDRHQHVMEVFAVHAIALDEATKTLAQIGGEMPSDDWLKELFQAAIGRVQTMTEDELEATLTRMQSHFVNPPDETQPES